MFKINAHRIIIIEENLSKFQVSIIRRKKNSYELEESVNCFSYNAEQAYMQCIGELKKNRRKIPSKAIVVSQDVKSFFLEVDADTVEWEVQEYVEGISGLSSIRELVNYSGIFPQQVRELIAENVLNETGFWRQGILEDEVLDEKELLAVEKLLENRPDSNEPSSSEWRSFTQSDFKLCASFPQKTIHKWKQILAHDKISLIGVSSRSMIRIPDVNSLKDLDAYIEYTPEGWFLSSFVKGSMKSFAFYPGGSLNYPPALIQDIVSKDFKKIAFADNPLSFNKLQDEVNLYSELQLEEILTYEVTEKLVQELVEQKNLLIKDVREKLPPYYKRPFFYFMVAIIVWGIVALSYLYTQKSEVQKLQADVKRWQNKNQKLGNQISASSSLFKRGQKLKSEITILERQLELAEQQHLNEVSDSSFIIDSIDALVQEYSNEIYVEQIKAFKETRFEIKGYALTQEPIRIFTKEFISRIEKDLKGHVNSSIEFSDDQLYHFQILSEGKSSQGRRN